MPDIYPTWSYNRFQIVPDRYAVDKWNIQERKFLGFFRRWRKCIGIDTIEIIRYDTIEEAKSAIDMRIKRISQWLEDDKKIIEWRKTRPIDHP